MREHRRLAALVPMIVLGLLPFVPHRAAATAIPAPTLAAAAVEPSSTTVMPLQGEWRFALDPESTGLQDGWERRTFEGRIALPGALQAQGFGDAIALDTPWTGQIVDRSFFTAAEYEPYRQPGRIQVPFWLQPERYYAGAAWYQRDVEIPAEWQGKRLVLTLERPHWQTMVWLDRRIVGSSDSLSTPHVYDLGINVPPGRHTLTIRVDNRVIVDIGVNSHSISDHTQGNWNGIIGRLDLAATPPVWLDPLRVTPDVAKKSVRITGRIGNATGSPGRGRVRLTVSSAVPASRPGAEKVVDVQWSADGGTWAAEYPLAPDARLWDEFDPALYRLNASLDNGAFAEATFGLRAIAVYGTQFTINGRKTFLRGTLECAIFPKTGHPPTDVDSWTRIIRIAQAHGLNHMRFHSWCPPKAAFQAADTLGFYLQVEAASWANQSTRLGVGLPVDDWIYKETDRILDTYGNHPSFVLMAYGNEPEGRHEPYLARWLSHVKAADSRRLYTAGSGWPQIAESEFHVTPDPRIQAWGQGLASRINAKPPETRTDYRDYIRERKVPVVSHEIGQWCAFPNFDEIPKYTGYLKPKNLEIFKARLDAQGLGHQARAFLHASGKLQTLCYKEDIESALRTPGMGGFQLLDLHDFPGQGTALVGVLDAFWDSKGYVTPEEYRRFSNATVPLARLDRRVFTTAERLTAALDVAHFGAAPLTRAAASWRLLGDGGEIVARGQLPSRDVPVGDVTPMGSIDVALGRMRAPARYRLVVSIDAARGSADGARAGTPVAGTPAASAPAASPAVASTATASRVVENDWDVWVYPPRVQTEPRGVTVVRELDDAALSALRAGGRVLLLIEPSRVKPDPVRGPIALGFSSIFWNTAWTRGQAPHTLGILCDPRHPALAAFPTDTHSNWQWWYIVSQAGAMILDGLPRELQPVVQVIDDWFTSRKLALAFEARVAGGRLLVASVDLADGLNQNIVARQMRHSLLAYMQGERFAPTVALSPEQVRGLMSGARAGAPAPRP